MTSLPLVNLLYELQYVPYWDVQPTHLDNNKGSSTDGASSINIPEQYAINMICVPKSRLLHNSASNTGEKQNDVNSSNSSPEHGKVSMIGYVEVLPDRPYLHQYFAGRYSQAGNELNCGDGGVFYEMK